MKNDRLGLFMMAATLGVIAIILAVLVLHQGRSHEKQVRSQGIVMARSLSSLPFDQLLSQPDKPGTLRTLVGVQRSADFAYALVVSPSGERLTEVAAAGTMVPNAKLPSDPAGWFGDQSLQSPEDGRRIVEFHAPVMAAGALAGFVRVGYYAATPLLGMEQISFAALLALPVFLLSPLAYFLMRREFRPLSELERRIHTMAEPAQNALVTSPERTRIDDFAQRLERFLGVLEGRVRQLEAERIDSVVSHRLLGYKKDRVEAVLHSLHDGVMILDASGKATFANAKVEPLLGSSQEQIAGRLLGDWCNQPDLLAFLVAAQADPVQRETAIQPSPDCHLTLSSFPLFSPLDPATLLGTLVLVRDVGQERLLKEAGAQFVANVSHELKTPLNTIASYSEILMDPATLTDSQRVEAVNVIHDEVERMALLINNMLNISKLETGAMSIDRQRVNLRDLLRDSFESLRQSAVGRGIEFRIEVPPNLGSALLDKALFRIALNNLLSNAIKYNRPGGYVTLAAEDNEDGNLNIFVRDGGIGIAHEQCARIFEKYYRVGGAASTTSGHGLGLYLARQIIELHHGRISVQSEPGNGTEFSVQIQKQTAPYQEAVAA